MTGAEIYIRMVINAPALQDADIILQETLSGLGKICPTHTPLVPYEEDEHFETKIYGRLTCASKEELQKEIAAIKRLIGEDWLLHQQGKPGELEEEWIYNHEAFILHEPRFCRAVKWALLSIST